MKLICKQSDLANALNIVQKAISSKTTLPILTGILLEAKNGALKLTGNDLSIGIEKSIEANILEEGTTVVSSKIFGEFVRSAVQSTTAHKPHKAHANIICNRYGIFFVFPQFTPS